MTILSDEQILAELLYKLFNNRCYRKGHMLEERVVSGIAVHFRGQAKKILKRALKDQWIVTYGKTKYGVAYQLNLGYLQEIKKFIKKHKPSGALKE